MVEERRGHSRNESFPISERSLSTYDDHDFPTDADIVPPSLARSRPPPLDIGSDTNINSRSGSTIEPSATTAASIPVQLDIGSQHQHQHQHADEMRSIMQPEGSKEGELPSYPDRMDSIGAGSPSEGITMAAAAVDDISAPGQVASPPAQQLASPHVVSSPQEPDSASAMSPIPNEYILSAASALASAANFGPLAKLPSPDDEEDGEGERKVEGVRDVIPPAAPLPAAASPSEAITSVVVAPAAAAADEDDRSSLTESEGSVYGGIVPRSEPKEHAIPPPVIPAPVSAMATAKLASVPEQESDEVEDDLSRTPVPMPVPIPTITTSPPMTIPHLQLEDPVGTRMPIGSPGPNSIPMPHGQGTAGGSMLDMEDGSEDETDESSDYGHDSLSEEEEGDVLHHLPGAQSKAAGPAVAGVSPTTNSALPQPPSASAPKEVDSAAATGGITPVNGPTRAAEHDSDSDDDEHDLRQHGASAAQQPMHSTPKAVGANDDDHSHDDRGGLPETAIPPSAVDTTAPALATQQLPHDDDDLPHDGVPDESVDGEEHGDVLPSRSSDSSTDGGLPTSGSKAPILFAFPEADELSEALGQYVLQAQHQSIIRRGSFRIAVSGGSLAHLFASGVLRTEGIEFDKWELFFVDERVVPRDSPDSNYGLIRSVLLDRLAELGMPMKPEQIHAVGDFDQRYSAVDQADALAEAYEKDLIDHFDVDQRDPQPPKFDLILLGMGSDGHIASLFPSHRLLNEQSWFVCWLRDSPKEPAVRMTFSLPVINAARRVAFVVTGSSKAEALNSALSHPQNHECPASLVNLGRPAVWFADDLACAKTAYPTAQFWED